MKIAQGQITAQEAVKQMNPGINLGNTLEPPLEGNWNNGPAQEYYFDLYKEAGFKTIRIPVRWDKHTANKSPYTINEDWLDRVEEVIDWGLERDLFIIVNAHHEDWFKVDYQNQKERMDSIWSQVSLRFKDKPENLFFEIINEPRTAENTGLTQAEIDEFNNEILNMMRKNNPTRIVLYGGKGWSSSSDLLQAAIPNPDDEYLMGYYHSYDPWNFAGQGEGTWGTKSDINSMASQMTSVQEWSQKNNIPVIIGEFGAIEPCDFNSKMFWYANYVEQANAHNLAWTEWDDGGNFQTMMRPDSTWNVIKDILVFTSDSSPTALATTIVSDTAIQLTWSSRSDSKAKVLIEKQTLENQYITIAEIGATAPTIYTDTDAIVGEYSIYRVVEVYNDSVRIPSYPIRDMRISTQREPYHGAALAIPGTIEAEDYDIGGQSLTYNDNEAENIPGDYRPDEGVDIEQRPDEGYQVGYVEEGEWIEYTIDVAKAANYKITAKIASLDGGGEMKLLFSGNNKEFTLTAPKTGDWTTIQEVSTTGYLEEGEQILRLNIVSLPAFNIDNIEISEYTGVKEFENNEISISPNPVLNELNIRSAQTLTNNIVILDIHGSIVSSHKAEGDKTSINVNHLKPGIYFVQITSLNNINTFKFIKK